MFVIGDVVVTSKTIVGVVVSIDATDQTWGNPETINPIQNFNVKVWFPDPNNVWGSGFKGGWFDWFDQTGAWCRKYDLANSGIVHKT